MPPLTQGEAEAAPGARRRALAGEKAEEKATPFPPRRHAYVTSAASVRQHAPSTQRKT